MFLKLEGNETEPLGKRIVESPEDAERTELLRDPHSGFIAYVPPGSIKRGEALVLRGGGGKTIACADVPRRGPRRAGTGAGNRGTVAELPGAAALRHAGWKPARHWTELMKPVVAKLTPDDMIAIVAYTASRPVGAGADKKEISRAEK